MNGAGPTSTRLVVLLAASLALLVAGCEQREAPAQYEKKVAASLEKRQRFINGIPPNAQSEYYLTAKSAFEEDIKTLRELSPPVEVEQAHDAYLNSLRGSVRLLQRLADCSVLGKADIERGRECIRKISSQELDQVENDYREAVAIFSAQGYDIIEKTAAADAGTQLPAGTQTSAQ